MADDEVKQEECPPGSPLWMCTFADLMSLLLCFFVLLLSFSVMDAQQFKQVAGSMKNAFGIQRETRVTGSPSGDVMLATDFLSTPLAVKVQQAIDDVVAKEAAEGDIETELLVDGILVRMKDQVAFDFGRAELRDKGKAILEKIGKIIAALDVKITVSGHTDNVPLKKGGPYRSNWGLSTARAVSVVEFWHSRFHIPTAKMSAAGYAEGRPIQPNDTASGRAANRRVEFKIQADQKTRSIKELSDMLIRK